MDSQSKLVHSLDKKDYVARLKEVADLPAYKNLWKSNEDFEKKYKFLTLVINFQAAAILVLSVGLYFFVSRPFPSDRFFSVINDSQISQLVGLYRPNNNTEALSNWVSKAVVDIMTFGFNDYNQRFDVSKNHFTKNGWEAFRTAVIQTGFVREVEQNKQILTAAPISEPILLKDGFIDGSFKWVFSVKFLLTFRSGSSQSNSAKSATIFVERVPTEDNPIGVGISSFLL